MESEQPHKGGSNSNHGNRGEREGRGSEEKGGEGKGKGTRCSLSPHLQGNTKEKLLGGMRGKKIKRYNRRKKEGKGKYIKKRKWVKNVK